MNRPALAFAIVFFASAPAARGEPPKRYGDAALPQPRTSLAARAEAAAIRAGERLGASVDPRLEVALDLLVVHLPESGPPPVELSERALRLAGIVEPTPYLLTITVPEGAEEDALRKVSEMVPDMLARGRYLHIAAATAPLGADSTRLVLALLESYIKLAPIARALPAGQEVHLDGSVLPPYRVPGLFITAPDGSVKRPPIEAGTGGEGSFHAAFHCGPPSGAWQVEVVAEDRFGEAVLANFPVYCGVPAPRILETQGVLPAVAPIARAMPAAEPPAPALLRATAETRALELLQADRKHAGIASLTLDPRLSAIARAHSEDMRDNNFFGHLSPRTGSAMTRLEQAHVVVLRVRENLGRAFSAEELERGLMGSPSHRANLLSDDVQRVGVGIAVGMVSGSSGVHDLYLTQLFAHFPEAFDPARADGQLRARLDAIRGEAKLPAFIDDPALDAVAREVAKGLADGSLSAEHALDGKGADSGKGEGRANPVARALPVLSDRFKWLRKVSALALDISQFGTSPALLEREATHAGVAVVQVPAATAARAHALAGHLYLVVLLASKR